MKWRDYEGYATAAFRVGAVLGLLTVLAVLITALTFRSLGVLIALAVVAALIIMAIVFRLLAYAYDRSQGVPRRKDREPFVADNSQSASGRAQMESLRNEFIPGMRFWAWGSMGQQLEGEFIRWIDRDTLEAIVCDPRGGPREKGPFPLKDVLGIKP